MLTAINYIPTYSRMKTSTGYGKIERGLYYGLTALKRVPITLMGTLDPSAYEVVKEARILSPRAVMGEVSFLTGRAFYARDMFPVPNTVSMLYSMNESTELTRQEVTLINHFVDCVLVPANGMVDIYRESGVKRPVFYVGGGVDLYMQTEWPSRSRRLAESPNEPFTWLTVSYGDLRKGADRVIQAFVELFARNPNHRLIIKARDDAETSWLSTFDIPGVTVVGGMLSHTQWNALLRQAHAFVFPSRGEGYGLPPREATLAGLPTVATRWLGMSDIDKWGYGLDYEMVNIPIGNDMNADSGKWAQPSLETLKAHMQFIFEHYDEAEAKAAAGRRYLMQNDSFISMASRVLKIAESYQEWKR